MHAEGTPEEVYQAAERQLFETLEKVICVVVVFDEKYGDSFFFIYYFMHLPFTLIQLHHKEPEPVPVVEEVVVVEPPPPPPPPKEEPRPDSGSSK